MDATATKDPPRLIAGISQPGDLSSGDGNIFLCNEALYLAQRMAERGEPEQARVKIRDAQVYSGKITDVAKRGMAEAWIVSVSGYVEDLSLQSEGLRTQAGVSDATYERSQVLTAAQLQENADDNADLRRAQDAQARGENPTVAYTAGYVARGAEKASAGVKDAVTGTVSAALGPWKWWIAAAVGVSLLGGLVYAVVMGRSVKGAVS